MTTYRVWCRYEPDLRRLGGQVRGSAERIVRRGAWRIVPCSGPNDLLAAVQIDYTMRWVGVCSPRPQRAGTLADPFKLLKAWQAARRDSAS